MKLTGHKTLAMFLRYSHLDKEQSEDAMQKLDGFLLERGNNGNAPEAAEKKKSRKE